MLSAQEVEEAAERRGRAISIAASLKLGLEDTGEDHRRVLAVLAYLG